MTPEACSADAPYRDGSAAMGVRVDAKAKVVRVVILHGAYRRPDSNWFPWLAGRVQASGHEALIPCFPTPPGQSPEAWLEAYDRQVDGTVPRSRTVLVAHSLGVAFALRLAARAGANDAYRGAFLAAGFWGALGLPDYDPINGPFFAPLDWEAARAGCGASVTCYAGDNDPYVPLRFSRELAERLGSPLRILIGGKHLNAENGMTTFRELEHDLSALLVSVRRRLRR